MKFFSIVTLIIWVACLGLILRFGSKADMLAKTLFSGSTSTLQTLESAGYQRGRVQ